MAASRSGGASSMVSKVVVLDLVEERQFTTKANDTFLYYLVRDTDFEELGPWLESIQIAAELVNPSSAFVYKVIGRKSFRGQLWEDFAGDVLAEQIASSAGKAIVGTPYATAADLGFKT